MFQGHPVPSTRHYAARPAGRAIAALATVMTFDACLARLLATLAGSSDQGAGRFVAEPLVGTPAIHDAAVFGPLSPVERMLERGPASVGATYRFDFMALHGVVAEHHFDIARLLVEPGPWVKTHETTPRQPRIVLPGVPQHHVQRGNHRRLRVLEPIGRLRTLEELRVAASQNAHA